MDEQQLMITFSVLSFSVLGLGSIILSLVTLVGKGNRSFANGTWRHSLCDVTLAKQAIEQNFA